MVSYQSLVDLDVSPQGTAREKMKENQGHRPHVDGLRHHHRAAHKTRPGDFRSSISDSTIRDGFSALRNDGVKVDTLPFAIKPEKMLGFQIRVHQVQIMHGTNAAQQPLSVMPHLESNPLLLSRNHVVQLRVSVSCLHDQAIPTHCRIRKYIVHFWSIVRPNQAHCTRLFFDLLSVSSLDCDGPMSAHIFCDDKSCTKFTEGIVAIVDQGTARMRWHSPHHERG
mmetsp:Transcript_13393/g.33421  ORF Transcript_13393/g.33421 Transcript_13393/m.33421 type:complete len:224 (-) Transcript_13393:2839-3510(-)